MDQTVVTDLVEAYWRTAIPAMQNGGAAAFHDVSERFEQRIAQTAATMSPIEAATFTQQVEGERERLMAEYQADPVALKRRLGVPMGRDSQGGRVRHSGGDLGNLAVRTVVRATIWESIWALFRAFR